MAIVVVSASLIRLGRSVAYKIAGYKKGTPKEAP